ncbi:transporter substrate-binding domain-containing protein [Cyanobacterium aponinum FACHB-4101]|uniref:transporter substrate-binding domain-containing protein n=1 Tax=Cyanobacterium aponinum TaxID=379064 RepID=UPI0016817D63|nr:transporter substrate-binding domain-containing protein [Cyanobacterium aponinum]MBD2393363.1 transporter substrate-binding domain-containing protein [Cyanobacterium aponinum FACHB-4101]
MFFSPKFLEQIFLKLVLFFLLFIEAGEAKELTNKVVGQNSLVKEINSSESQIIANSKRERLRVATKSFPPFAFEENGQFVGFSIDLWKEIANELDVDFNIYGEKTISDLLNSVTDGYTDVGVAGITITWAREKDIDFSHSFFESGLQILVPMETVYPWQFFFAFIFSPILWSTVAIILVVIAIASHLIWWLERKNNPQMFPENYKDGIWEAFWWAVVTVVTVGYGDKTPTGKAGRIIATIWMFTGVLLISYFTASVSSILTVQRLDNNITTIQDLYNKSVGTVKGSTAAEFLASTKSYVVLFDSIEDAFLALDDGKIKAIVYDAPVLRYYSRSDGAGKVKIVGSVFERQSYGIALKSNSPYRESVNQAILKLKEDGTYERIYQQWFGAD